MIENIIKDLENNLNIKVTEKDITYYTDGATDSIVFNIMDKYLVKTMDDITYKTQKEFLEFYNNINEFQTIIHHNPKNYCKA